MSRDLKDARTWLALAVTRSQAAQRASKVTARMHVRNAAKSLDRSGHDELADRIRHLDQCEIDADARCEIRAVMTLIDEEIVPSADVSDLSEPTRRGSSLLRTDGEADE